MVTVDGIEVTPATEDLLSKDLVGKVLRVRIDDSSALLKQAFAEKDVRNFYLIDEAAIINLYLLEENRRSDGIRTFLTVTTYDPKKWGIISFGKNLETLDEKRGCPEFMIFGFMSVANKIPYDKYKIEIEGGLEADAIKMTIETLKIENPSAPYFIEQRLTREIVEQENGAAVSELLCEMLEDGLDRGIEPEKLLLAFEACKCKLEQLRFVNLMNKGQTYASIDELRRYSWSLIRKISGKAD